MIRSAAPALLAFLAAASVAAAQDQGGYMNSDGTQRTLYIGEPSRDAGVLTFGCFLGDMTVAAPATKTMRLIIPAALGVQWDTTLVPIVGGPQAAKVQLPISVGTKTITITTTAGGLLPGDIFTLSNVRYRNMSSASSDSLFLDKDGNATFTQHLFGVDDRDPTVNTITVAGNPTFSVNGGSQVYRTGDPDTACGQLNITDHASFPGIKVGTNIRLQIPSTLNMTWDTTIGSVTVGGTAAGKVNAAGVTYPTTRIAQIPVTTSFAAGDTLTINGLEFRSFGAASGPLGLQLVVNGGTHASATSAQTFRVAGLPSISMTTQTFGLNDPVTNLNTVTVTDDASVAMINTTNDIELRIPVGLGMTWNTADTSVTFGGNLRGGAVSFPDSKTCLIQVTSNFLAGESLTISGLSVTNFSAVGFDSLELDADADATSEDTAGATAVVAQPTITLSSSASYNQGEEATAAPTITILDSNLLPRIRAVDNIRVRIPAGLNMAWNTAITAPGLVVSGGSAGTVAATVSYPDSKTLLIDVTADFSVNRQLVITGLQFQSFVASGPLGLQLDVAGVGTIVHTSTNTILIGGAPSIGSSAQSFTFGDSNLSSTSVASSLTITDAASVPMITTAQNIRIKIPAGFNMTWDTSVGVIGSNNAKVSTTLLPYEDAGRTAVLDVITTNFTSGESVVVTGLRFANFNQTGSTNLQLEVDGDVAAEATDAFAKGIGRPNISSAANQTFNQGEESTLAANIVVTEDGVFPRIRADNTTGDIRVRIPAGLNMEWDTTVTAISAVMGGGGGGNVSSTVSYDSVRILRVDVTADFAANKTVTLSGLRFRNFGAASGPFSLELICSGSATTTVCRSDDKTIQVGGTASISSAAQSFTFNDPSTVSTSTVNAITITDALGVPMITTAQDIRIRIPLAFGMTWDTSVAAIGSTNAKVSTTVLGYEDSDHTVVLNVITSNFTSGESVTITGLRFANFTQTGSTQLELEVDGDVAAEAVSAANSKSVGRPNISSTSNQTFNENEEATAAATIRVSDDGSVARIRAVASTGDIRVRIPAGLNMTWNTGITTVTATVTGTGVVSTTLLPYEDGNKTAVLNVTTDFGAGAFVDISGLQFSNFVASGPDNLELIVNGTGPSSVCREDDKTIQVGGRVTISSASNQFLIVGDSPTTAAAVTVTDASGVPMINTATDLRVVIPPGLGVTWNTGVTTVGSNNAKVQTTGVTYTPDFKTAILVVTSNFAASESVTVTGLQFATPTAASTGSLAVEVDGDVAAEDDDDKTIVIGGPTMASAAVQNFTKNDPATAMSTITITEAAGGASVKAATDIRIVIPAGVNMTWNTGITTATFGGTANTRVANPVSYEGGKTLVIPVNTDFAAGQTLTVSGLQFTAFGNSSTGNLTLQVDLDSAAEATDTQQVRIGSPTISSAANQSFNVSDPPAAMSAITVTEDALNPRITAAGDLRIRIPAGLDMVWDNGVLTATFGGTAAGRVSNPVSLADAGKTLVIPVSTNFAAGETLTVSDLNFGSFNSESSSASLELVVNSVALTACNFDDKTKQIGGQADLISTSQSFAVGDPATAAASILITDAPGSPKITAADDIRIKIPAGLDMTWDTSVGSITASNAKITTTGVTYEDAGKTAVILVNADFAASESTTIGGLAFDNFGGAGSGQLTLELDGDASAEATDPAVKGIGAPTLSSSGAQVFPVGPGPLPAASFTIMDDGSFPRIRSAAGLRLRIPAGLNMVWQNLATAGISMGGGSGNVSTSVSYADAFKTLVLTVTGDFSAGQTVTVSGLAFQSFTAPSTPDFLLLEVTAAGFTTDVDNQSKAIQGSPSLASASQGFTINDPATDAASFLITDAGGVATITTAQDIRLVIPPGLNMTWDSGVGTVSSNNAKVSTTVLGYENGNKTVVLDVVTNFNPLEAVTIGGLRFASFGASSTGQLTLDVGGATALDSGVKGVGVPTLVSASNQVFLAGAGPTAAAQIVLTDDAATPRFRANDADGDIRIKIPASLDMTWNTAITAPGLVVGGTGAVAATVSYPTTKELLIDVTTNFGPGATLTISGLQFANFNSPSLPAALELEVNNQDTNAGVDTRTKAIQGTPTIASAAQAFAKGDLPTNAAAITIGDAGGVAMITAAGDIRIRIPVGLDLTWDTSVGTITSNNGKVSTALLPFEDAGKTAVLNVTGDFSPAESVLVGGLRFANFGSSSAGQLTLEVDGDPAAEATDAGVKGIGAPTIASAANQAFNVGDAATPIAAILVSEDAARPRLRAATDLRIRIPSGFNMSWDATDTGAALVVGPGTGSASGTVSYEAGNSVLVVDILTDFSISQTIQISGLAFTNFQGESPVDRLELDVSAAGTTCNEDANTIVIGGLPSISSAASQAFTVNDPATPIAAITLTDAPGVATFRASRDIRVRIPSAFPMEWNTSDTTAVVSPGAGAGVVSATVSFPDAKTLQLDVTTDFSPGQTLTVSGLSFANFSLPSSGFSLELDADLDVAAEAVDDKTLAIGAPSLSSASSQLFVVGDPATPASDMTVSDGAVARITAANDIRIRIPASTGMTWDTSLTSLAIGGSAAGKASATVTYEDGGKTLVVDVLGNLAALETLVISGAAFTAFGPPSAPASLELEVNNLGTAAALDDKTKAVRGLPSLVSAANQAFTTGDPATAAAQMTVTDAGGVAVITSGGDIRIQIPAGFGMTWNTALTTPTFGGASGKVAATVTYADGDRTLVIDVTSDFVPGEVLTISGVGFANFLSASAPANLLLDLDGDGGPEVVDTATIAIGAPTLASAANQVFGGGDPSTPISPITITEDALTPRIRAATDLRIRIPASFGMTWNTALTSATVVVGGAGGGAVASAVSYEDAGQTLVLDVTADFAAGQSVQVSGLEFDAFTPSAVDRLRLETNNLGTDADLDAQTIRVGTRPSVVSATTGDANGNGSIDRLIVVFNEDVDGTSAGVTNAAGFTLAGYTLAFGLEAAPGVVTFFVPETGIRDTGATPALSYDPVVGQLLDADEGLEPNAFGPLASIDGAPPRIVGFVFEDTDGNGRLDRLVYTFSELMDETQEDLSDWTIVDGDGVTDLLAGLTDGDLEILGNVLTITLADTTGTTLLPRYRYFEDGSGGALRDLVGLALPNASNNTLPVADAGLDRTFIPSAITLDGSGSSDSDGQVLTFSWAQTAGPAVVLSGAGTPTPSFTAIGAATYVFELTVSDGLGQAVDSVSITILNVPPSPFAGVDQTVTAGATVTLDGSASFDTNGDAIGFDWTQLSGTAVVLSSSTAVQPTFDSSGLNEVLVFRLTVTDTAANAKSDDVVVRVNAVGNAVPTAHAGGDYVAVVGVPLTLDGGLSVDPEGGALTYAWEPASLLTSPLTASPTFTPATPGVLVFTLVVTDASGVASAPATARVTVLPAGSTNRPPLAAATVVPASPVVVGTPVTLDGSASLDPDGHSVRFAWTQVSGPVIMFPNPSAAAPSFTPVVPGSYVFQLLVSDATLAGTPLLVTVQVLPAAGAAPLAQILIDLANDPEGDRIVSSISNPITLDGSGSSGTGLSYAWTQTSGPAVVLGGATTDTATFSPTAAGLYVFALLVIDGDGLRDFETIEILVNTPANEAPVAAAGPDQSGAANAAFTLDGSASFDSALDGDAVTSFGDGLRAFWRQVSGPLVTLSDPTAASPTFTPKAGGTYVFELTVSDGAAASFGDSVSVTVSAPGGGGGGGSSGGGGCGLTGFEVLLLLAFRRRRHMGCAAAR